MSSRMSSTTTVSGKPVNFTVDRNVTSEIEGIKTKEIQRRRRLRLQQVREQSKDIAKTVRERADKERLVQLGRVENDKREDYIERQERLVQRLERIHSKSVQSVGTAHSEAAILNEKDKNFTKAPDHSKPRGKLAAAELKKNKQKELDNKKQFLDRILIARNLANARCRLKLSKAGAKEKEETGAHNAGPENTLDVSINSKANGAISVHHEVLPSAEKRIVESEPLKEPPNKRDMETQWSVDGLREWIPSGGIPAVASQNIESQNGLTDFATNTTARDLDKNVERRRDLFAVSEEMPDSLRRPLHKIVSPVDSQNKPSLSIVSDFLRTRDNRLQKPEAGFHKVTDHELQGLRESYRIRRNEGTADICRVVDNEAIPVPSWEPVPNCGFCTFDPILPKDPLKMNRNMCVVNPHQTRSRSAVNTSHHDPRPAHRFSSPLPPSRVPSQPQNTPRGGNSSTSRITKSSVSGQSSDTLNKKHLVKYYDHNTKTTRDLPLETDKLVEKMIQPNEMDAYSLALKESEEILAASNKNQHEHVDLQRSRVAVSRQRVAKEYKDTMDFLHTVSRDSDKNKPIESAFMDDDRQHKRRASLQRKLQNEFEKVQEDTTVKVAARRNTTKNIRILSSPSMPYQEIPMHLSNQDVENAARTSMNDAQALLKRIRTLPTREISNQSISIPNKGDFRKSHRVGNTVKFDFAPSSYEYTSNFKHTPPTKDNVSDFGNCKDKNIDKTEENYMNVDTNETDNTSEHTLVSDCSSDYDLIIQRHKKSKSKESSDVKKFIVYKIRDSGDEDAISRRRKNKSKLTAAKSKDQTSVPTDKQDEPKEEHKPSKTVQTNIEENDKSLEELEPPQKEAVESLKFEKEESNLEMCHCHQKKQSDESKEQNKMASNRSLDQRPQNWDIGPASAKLKEECECTKKSVRERGTQPTASAATSAVTFQTATSDKSSTVSCTVSVPNRPPSGCVTVLDEAGEQAGKFYIGASHSARCDPYEVVIQLKRREDSHRSQDRGVQSSSPESVPPTEQNKPSLKKSGATAQPTLITPAQEAQFSSSSSTVYMSPPDLIMPKFLRSDYRISEENIHYPSQNNTHSKGIDIDIEKKDSTHQVSCSQQNRFDSDIKPSTSEVKRRSRTSSIHNKRHSRLKVVDTPVSSTSSPRVTNVGKTKKQKNKRNCPCYECINKAHEKETVKRTKKQSHEKPSVCSKQSRSNRQACNRSHLDKIMIETYVNEVYNKLLCDLRSNSDTAKSKKDKSHLSPLVQKYINELLEMSKDGLKGVEVAALQCSSVSTPGSSVINVPSNVDTYHSFNERGQGYDKINEIMTKTLTKQYHSSIIKTHQLESQKPHSGAMQQIATASSSDSQNIENGTGDVPRLHLNKFRAKAKTIHRHKIKSLNIPKNILKYFKAFDSEERKKSVYLSKSAGRLTSSDTRQKSSEHKNTDNIMKDFKTKPQSNNIPKIRKLRPNIVTPKKSRRENNTSNFKSHANSNITKVRRTASAPIEQTGINLNNNKNRSQNHVNNKIHSNISSVHKANISELNEGSQNNLPNLQSKINERLNLCSIQSKPNLNTDNLMYIAEAKLQNMEKIADLTEKCTKRLSNLAKVLDEVRKNKSNMYNQISSSDSTSSDNLSWKLANSLKCGPRTGNLTSEKSLSVKNDMSDMKNSGNMSYAPVHVEPGCQEPIPSESKQTTNENTIKRESTDFVPILGDIPKPKPVIVSGSEEHTQCQHNIDLNISSQNDDIVIKTRSRPPPALARINLKSEDTLVVHELSTVLEVDSPMSTRNASSRVKSKSPQDIHVINSEQEVQAIESNFNVEKTAWVAATTTPPCMLFRKSNVRDNNSVSHSVSQENQNNMLHQSSESLYNRNREAELRNVYLNEPQHNYLSPLSLCEADRSTNNPDNLKLKMMDLNKFSEIILKPFISIEDYARQYNIALLDDGSNLEDTTMTKKMPILEEEISSVNSDGTLPDIISELLKRNIISEPFNYDGILNKESNTMSSESNTSLLAIAKTKRHKKKVTINTIKGNNGDLSDSVSLSSKMDLEKAFEELGIGWASSTLKKTKETLALSSSTSTVSSIEHTNYSKFDKSRKLIRQLKTIISDTSKIHSATTEHACIASTSGARRKDSEDKENKYNKSAKHSVQLQTSKTFQQPVSVNEFLAHSLASKITFSNNSPRRDEEPHFTSLYSTKLSNDYNLTEGADKPPAGEDSTVKQNSRQRTSTPVQLFKSLTFNSSTSSYNNSNGFLNNFDDLSSVKGTSLSLRNSSSTDKDELTLPSCSLRMKKKSSKSDDSDTI